jgi:hypothetical protein
MKPERAVAIMAVYEKADLYDELTWHVVYLDDADNAIAVKLYANCSNLFTWSMEDREEILAEDFPLLMQTLLDLQQHEAEYHLSDLFAARKRKMRPRRTFRPVAPGVQALFGACGPERTDSV